MSKKPVVLMVLDGYGLSDHKEGNAIAMANTPVMDKLMAECPFVKGAASGLAVGLPDGQMGNSEVGHMNIGAGRIVYQDLVKINRACADGSILKNPEIVSAYEYAKQNGKSVHLMGLTSTGGVHSSLDQMVEFTAISSIFTDFLSFARKRILTEYMYTHSLMVVIHLLHQARTTSSSFSPR